MIILFLIWFIPSGLGSGPMNKLWNWWGLGLNWRFVAKFRVLAYTIRVMDRFGVKIMD